MGLLSWPMVFQMEVLIEMTSTIKQKQTSDLSNEKEYV